ncbi:MAG: trehalose-phosphatase [Vicinamibacterales bacterium]
MLAEVQAAVSTRPSHTTLVLLFDFDGTLAEFDPDPAAPVLSPSRRERLEAMARRDDVSVGIVSGRRLDDLRARTKLPPSIYHAGLHGLEIAIGDRHWEHPDLRRGEELLAGLAHVLAAVVDQYGAAFIEDKQASVAIHARRYPEAERKKIFAVANAVAAPWILDGRVRPLEGNAVVEYLPNIGGHKGEATQWIVADIEARRQRPAWVAYVGDDITDEDAFRAITSGIAVLVGLRPTAATHKLNGIADVDLFLRFLASAE